MWLKSEVDQPCPPLRVCATALGRTVVLWWSAPQSTATSIWTRHPRRSRNRSIACRTCLQFHDPVHALHVTTPLQVCAFALLTAAIMLWSVRKSTARPIWIAALETRFRMRGEVATPHRALDDARRRGPGETFPVPTCCVFESVLFSLPTGHFKRSVCNSVRGSWSKFIALS